MADRDEAGVACGVCGAPSSAPRARIPGRGERALDGRPSTLEPGERFRLARCAACGYCALFLGVAPDSARETVRSDAYAAITHDADLPEDARWFQCAGLVLERDGLASHGFCLALIAAWVCESEGRVDDAARCRAHAIELVGRAPGARPRSEHAAWDVAIVDTLRRLGRFDEAAVECDRELGRHTDPGVTCALVFEQHLIARRDAGAHTYPEAFAWRAAQRQLAVELEPEPISPRTDHGVPGVIPYDASPPAAAATNGGPPGLAARFDALVARLVDLAGADEAARLGALAAFGGADDAPASREAAAWLARHAHLAAGGGAAALLQWATRDAPDALRARADAWLARARSPWLAMAYGELHAPPRDAVRVLTSARVREVARLDVLGNGARVVTSGSHDDPVRVWDVATGACLHELRPHESGLLEHLVAHPDGRRVLTSEIERDVAVTDATTGRVLARLWHATPPEDLVLDESGAHLFAGHNGGEVAVWSLDPLERLGSLRLGASAAIAPAASGRRVAVAFEGGRLAVWDVARGERVREAVRALAPTRWAIDARGERVVVASEAPPAILVWDVDTDAWREIAMPDGSTIVSIDPDGPRALVATRDGAVGLYDLGRGERVAEVARVPPDATNPSATPDWRYVYAVGINGATFVARIAPLDTRPANASSRDVWPAFAGENRVLSVDGRARLFEVSRDDRRVSVRDLDAAPVAQTLPTEVWSRGDRVVVLDDRGVVVVVRRRWVGVPLGYALVVYDLATAQRMRAFDLPHEHVAIGPDARAYVVDDRGLVAWDLAIDAPPGTPGVVGERHAVAPAPVGTLLLATSARGHAVWDVASGARVAEVATQTFDGRPVAALRGGRQIAFATGAELAVVDVATGAVAERFPGLSRFPDALVRVCPRGRRALALLYGTSPVAVLDLETGAQHGLAVDDGEVFDAAFTDDGAYVVTTGSRHDLALWHANDGALVARAGGGTHPSAANALVLHGSRAAVLAGDALRVYDVATARCLGGFQFDGHTSIALARDGRVVATRDGDAIAVLAWQGGDALATAAR